MQIALCDDDPQALEVLQKLLVRFCQSRGLLATFSLFTTGKAFLDSALSFDIVFMDVYLLDENGTEIIRTYQKNHQTAVVFTTTSLEALYQLLDPALFMRAQRSLMVNMRCIDTFHSDRVVLCNGVEISLSRANRSELKKQYQTFLSSLARNGSD